MRLLLIFHCFIWAVGVAHCAATSKNSTSTRVGSKESGTGVIGLPTTHRRMSKTLLQTKSSINNSTSNPQQRRSSGPGQVKIIEAGSAIRSRGDSRVLKRGPVGTRFSDTTFTLRNSVKSRLRSPGYGGASLSTSSITSGGGEYDEGDNIPIIAIPGSNVPPPVYSYDTAVGPPSTSGGSYGNPSPSFVPYKPVGGGGGDGGGGFISPPPGGGGFISPTPEPEFVLPPDVLTPEPGPEPVPIGPGVGTSVPIIGGGGGGIGSVLPPSPEEIFPPAPPPDLDEEFNVGRRLKVESGGTSGSPGTRTTGSSVRTRTRFAPSSKTTSSRVSVKDVIAPKEKLRGGVLRRERLRDKVKEFKTELVEVDEDQLLSDELLTDDPNVITDFVFSDIKCFKTRQNEYFGATIHMKSDFHLPYVRDRPQDPLSSEECRLEQVDGTRGSYHMAVTDLRGCGVENCGEAMCLTMVFPRVPMLALADDEVTTIKCIPQKSTMSDTKSISFAGDSMENRKSSSTVEGGLQEFVAEVGVFRQNPGSTNGLFAKRVNSGGVVQLGEPLQLRSVVRGTDGWKHSRLTDVKVWRMRDNMSHKLDNLDPKQASEVITLVDGQGCRNDEYVVIADDHPIKDPRNDMVHHFTFKAFLFRGQRVNEPLIVTARVHACQESQDCIMECESGGRRVKRSPVELHNASAIVHDFDSQLALRVVGLKDHPSSFLDDEFPLEYASLQKKDANRTSMDGGTMSCGEKMVATGLGGGCIMLLICGLTLALYTYIKQGRLHTKPSSPSHNSYRYPPPGRLTSGVATGGPAPRSTPYHKPLPPTPPQQQSQQEQPQPPQNNSSKTTKPENKSMNDDISQVAKLLQQLANNGNNNKSKNSGSNSTSNGAGANKHVHKEPNSEYACIDETNSSASTSSEDLSTANKKDGVYIVYCYNKDKKNKIMLPMSAPSSMRMRRKHLNQNYDDEDEDEDEDFVDADDSEGICSQTEEQTEESDDSYTVGSGNNKNVQSNMGKNQGCRRTVREVKKKSKQNNNLAYASVHSRIKRRVSSVYREGYMNGFRGASSRGGSFPLRYKKCPSTGNIPVAASTGYGNNHAQGSSTPQKRIQFSIRDSRSQRKRHQQKRQQNGDMMYSSEDMISEGTHAPSDLDSAYSGSNCSKLTEDYLYELKRGGGGEKSGYRPDFHNKLQNLVDVQHQLRNGAQGQKQKKEVRRTCSSNTTVPMGLESPPLPLGETKTTHFVTRDDSTTKILIVPETHV